MQNIGDVAYGCSAIRNDCEETFGHVEKKFRSGD